MSPFRVEQTPCARLSLAFLLQRPLRCKGGVRGAMGSRAAACRTHWFCCGGG